MIEVIGWIALAGGGAWVFGVLALMVATGLGLGGFETVPRGLAAGAVVAVCWIALVIWWSPLAVTVQ